MDSMTVERFVKVPRWCQAAGVGDIRVAGGEPTEHEEFPAFLELARYHGISVVLFTNGLINVDSFDNWEAVTEVFIQIHPQDRFGPEVCAQAKSSITAWQDRGIPITLSYTFVEPGYSSEIVDMAISCRKAALRIDIARSDLTGSNKYVQKEEFPEWRNEILSIVRMAHSRGLTVRLDCPLPLCMFTKEERYELKNHGLSGTCKPFPLVNPDLSVGCCPYPGLLQRDLPEIRPMQLTQLLNGNSDLLHLRWSKPPSVECQQCEAWIRRTCQGGCIRGKSLPPNNSVYTLPFKVW